MSCSYTPHLDDYVDAALTPADAAAFEAHLTTCSSCLAAVADLRAIRLAAASLERHEPPPYLWQRIEQEIRPRRSEQKRWWNAVSVWQWPAWTPVAAGALALIVAIGASTWIAFGPGARVDRPAPATAAVQAPVPESVEAELTQAQEHYERAIVGLEQITSTEGVVLDPQTSAVLQKNVSVIDQAIDESRAALATQPADPAVQESLFDAMRSKVALLQDTVALINEMRKGDPDGTARIISGLHQ